MLEILFEADIVKKTAIDLGMDEKKIEFHLEFMKKFINKVAEGEDIHAVQLPHLGTMYRNIKGHSYMNKYMSFRPTSERRKKMFERNERVIKKVLEELKSFDNISLHNTKRRIHNPYFTCIKSKKELEEFQNRDR